MWTWSNSSRSTSMPDPRGRPLILGILNVTPDSFSDGGLYTDRGAAVKHALALIEQGADIIDLGGESSRPGSVPVDTATELGRLVPVLEELVDLSVPVSVDTRKAQVAAQVLDMGAVMINDVGCLGDPGMARTVADRRAGIIAMASLGDPLTQYSGEDAISRAKEILAHAVATATDAGIGDDDIFLDPGIGFGTSPQQAREMLERAGEFSCGGHRVLVGPSRKRFLAGTFPGMDPDRATAEACRIALRNGAGALRVHRPDVVLAHLGLPTSRL